jgi:hypothetical protein
MTACTTTQCVSLLSKAIIYQQGSNSRIFFLSASETTMQEKVWKKAELSLNWNMTPFLSHPMKSWMFWKSQIGHCQISPQYFEKKSMLLFTPDCLRNFCSIHSKCPPQTECSKQHHIPCHHSPTDPQSLQSPVQCMIIRSRPSVHRDGDSDNCTRTNKACKVASPSEK